MSSFENVNPGNRDRFFSQNIAQNEPLKKMPSTAENAITRSAKESELLIHFNDHSAFLPITGIFEIELNKKSFSF